MSPALQMISLFGGIATILVLATALGHGLLHYYADGSARPVIENLNSRVHAWWAMVGVIGISFLLGKTGVVVLFALLSLAALREFMSLTDTRRGDHVSLLGAFYVVLPLQYVLVWQGWHELQTLFLPVYVFLLVPIITALSGDTTDYLARVAKTQWGLMLCVYCLSYVPALLTLDIPGYEQRHLLLVAFFLVVVQANDVFQFIWGKLIGRRKVAPCLSPSKTVEGLLGGTVCATALGTALWWLTPFDPWQAALMALAVSVMGFLGGLVMSAIKRDRGVKDWGAAITGHGGVLDRLDSVVFAAPVFFYLVHYGWAA